tara:strand:+ start:1027 stop:2379 length:1353 start_codon:yes stop_codon:yes gene_type:complete
MSRELLYGIVNSRGELITVTDDERDALKDARSVAKGRRIGVMQSPVEADKRDNARRITGREPQVALNGMWLSPVKLDDVMRYTPKTARAALDEVYADAPKSYATPAYTYNSLASKNAKLEKAPLKILRKNGVRLRKDIASYGLSLAPNTVAWKTPFAPAPLVQIRNEMGEIVRGMTSERKKSPNLCVYASPECIAGCLIGTGQNAMGDRDLTGKKLTEKSGKEVPPAARAQYYKKIRSTIALYENPEAFCRLLVAGIEAKRKSVTKQGNEFMFRLNVYSDIPWELFFPELFDYFRNVQFYDYTKVPSRRTPKNYDLTFSYSGSNYNFCEDHLSRGGGVTVVTFGGKDSKADKRAKESVERVKDIWGYPTINGDLYDTRPIDRRVLKAVKPGYDGGYVVSLMYKIPKLVRKVSGGFLERDQVGSFVVDVLYDKENDIFIGPQTPNQTAIIE